MSKDKVSRKQRSRWSASEKARIVRRYLRDKGQSESFKHKRMQEIIILGSLAHSNFLLIRSPYFERGDLIRRKCGVGFHHVWL